MMFGLVGSVAAACTVNPQPLPPEALGTSSSSGGGADRGSDSGPAALGNTDSGATPPASDAGKGGGDGGADAPPGPATDGGGDGGLDGASDGGADARENG